LYFVFKNFYELTLPLFNGANRSAFVALANFVNLVVNVAAKSVNRINGSAFRVSAKTWRRNKNFWREFW
jgi:hypothetical protein